MRNSGMLWIVLVAMILVDFYVFQVLKAVTLGSGVRSRHILFGIYWGISLAALLIFALLPTINFEGAPGLRNYLFISIVGLFLAKLLASVFFLADDLRRGIQWLVSRFSNRDNAGQPAVDGGISRSSFLSWLGLGLGGTMFSTLVYGFTNKYSYETRHVRLSYDHLPPAFRGLKILQLSDIHSGSFTNKAAVEKGIDKIMAENADIILFTGDLVNDRAVEMAGWKDVFGRLKAPMGVYSVLGNHDYGDYVHWKSDEEKRDNLHALKDVHGEMGWRLLMNEHVVLEREGQQIALIGIENWSAKARFPKHGRLKEACAGTEKYPFKILLSHDPSHWDAEVLPQYPDIDLALAGHTHGMQFGIDLPGIKWSPVQYVYKQWAGLYEQGKQKLYVNRGFGFIGYPGRVGIMPEITVIELA